jgi:malto-oligosyltrehalose trehalohydrolase
MNGHFRHRLPFGAELRGDGRTRFRVWAPSSRRADVVLDGGAHAMRGEGEGWHSVEIDAPPGTPYRFRFDDGVPVPDPASRAQRGGVAGASVVVDPKSYGWRHPAWRGRPWREAVIYELHAGLMGGFAGVARHLDRLASLGVTAIELMPVAEFPGTRNWGYDGVLPFAPASSYGTPDELKALVDAAHERGLMMLLDVVYNHFGPEGNHLASYADPFFRDDIRTPWGRAIDFRREEVREYFIENALYWIGEYRFDGLRLDAVHAIVPNDWLADLARRLRDSVDPRRHVHLVVENDANDAALLERGFDAQWNDDFHHAAHVLLTGERDSYYGDYAAAPAGELARCLAEGFAWQGRVSPHRGGALRGTPSAHLPPTAFVSFLQNHDQVGNRALGERLDALASAEAMRAARALLLLSPQVPLLWMGEEWGSRAPFHFFADFSGELADAVREGRRREFRAFAAFADERARERIPDPNAIETFRASMPDFDAAETAMLAHTRRLLAIRHARIVPRLEGPSAIAANAVGEAAIVASWRLGDGSVLALFANLATAPVSIDAPAGGEVLYETRAGDASALRTGLLGAHTLVAMLDGGEPDGR